MWSVDVWMPVATIVYGRIGALGINLPQGLVPQWLACTMLFCPSDSESEPKIAGNTLAGGLIMLTRGSDGWRPAVTIPMATIGHITRFDDAFTDPFWRRPILPWGISIGPLSHIPDGLRPSSDVAGMLVGIRSGEAVCH
jgi:hypothetical protein